MAKLNPPAAGWINSIHSTGPILSNQYQIRHLNPPEESAKQNQKTTTGIKQIRVNL
jgi:hypothetical protein